MENKFERIRKMKAEKVISELIFIGFFVLFVLNFTTLNNSERFVILGIIEATFVGTKVYCRISDEKKMNERKEKKNDKNDRS